MTAITSIGIIMDGNRRWAKARGLSNADGHRAGVEALKKVRTELPRLKERYSISHVTLYAFSTENWKRSSEEVSTLFEIFEQTLQEFLASEDDFVFKVIGERARVPHTVQALIRTLEDKTASREGPVITLALSYGGRAEVLAAANAAIEHGQRVSEEQFEKLLWSSDIPEPDLIIRTGGEKRLSNFLTWKSAYSELFFTDTLWPDFTTAELEEIFEEYGARKRRYGT